MSCALQVSMFCCYRLIANEYLYKVKSSNDAIKRAEMKQQVKLKFIEDENDEMLCKCLCGLNVTVDDVLTALEYIKESRLQKFCTQNKG